MSGTVKHICKPPKAQAHFLSSSEVNNSRWAIAIPASAQEWLSFLLTVTVHHGDHVIQVLRFSLNICKSIQLLGNACFEVTFSGTCISAPHTFSSRPRILCSSRFPLGTDIAASILLWSSCMPHIFFLLFQLQEVYIFVSLLKDVGNTFLTKLVVNLFCHKQFVEKCFQIDSHTIPDPVLSTTLQKQAHLSPLGSHWPIFTVLYVIPLQPSLSTA